MAKSRDDFPEHVKRNVGLRAGYLCSNADCRRSTCGPHSDPNKPIITGEAAHICAAALGGPRFDQSQTPEQRKCITNAIWLCGNCNKKVDADWKAWPAERLQQMKADHERWIAAESVIPSLPIVTLYTLENLRLHSNLQQITSAVQAALREQELVVRNQNRVELFNWSMQLQLPESVAIPGRRCLPTGPQVRFGPMRPALTAVVTGNASVTARPDVLTQHFRLEIDRLPANAEFRIAFYTVIPDQSMPYQLCKQSPDFWKDPEEMDCHKECHFYLEGSYQFVLRGEYVTTIVFVPLLFRAQDRTIRSYPVQDTVEPWRVWTSCLGSGATLQVGVLAGE